MKIENRSRKRSHKLNGIGFGRIRTFPFHPIAFTTPSLMIQCKLGCQSRKQKWKNQPIVTTGVEHCHWFILPLLLATPTMQFSLDRKRWSHKHNQCSASDSVSFALDRIVLRFWLRFRVRLRLRLHRLWKPALRGNKTAFLTDERYEEHLLSFWYESHSPWGGGGVGNVPTARS